MRPLTLEPTATVGVLANPSGECALIGGAAFGLASVLAALSTSAEMLIPARAARSGRGDDRALALRSASRPAAWRRRTCNPRRRSKGSALAKTRLKPDVGSASQGHHRAMSSLPIASLLARDAIERMQRRDRRVPTVALRPATPADEPVLHRLSVLDSAPDVERPALIAVVDDEPVAAISLADHRVVADPFAPTADVVALLRARAAA
jgi:hypothetical protein